MKTSKLTDVQPYDIHRYAEPVVITTGRLDGPGEPDRTPRWQRDAARIDRRARRAVRALRAQADRRGRRK